MKRIVDKITAILTGSLLVFMVIVACWQVFTRFILHSPSTVSEEFLRYSLIWLTMVGGAYAYGQKKHLAIVFLARKARGKLQLFINLLVDVIVMLFSVVILILGGTNTFQNAVGQVSPALRMPMEYLYLSLIIAGALFILYGLIHIKESFTKNKPAA